MSKRNEKAKVPYRWVCHHGGLAYDHATGSVEWRSGVPTPWSTPGQPFRGALYEHAKAYAARPWLV